MSRAPRTFASALLLASCGLFVPDARAGFPPFPNVTVPPCITLVGSDGVAASASGAFIVTVRDLANYPVPGVHVTFEVSSAFDLRLCAAQLDTNMVLNCGALSVTSVSDALGIARFTVMGGGVGLVGSGSLGNAGRVYANGILVASPSVSTYDLDGVSGVGANDLSLWLTDFGTGEPFGRSDYDCSGGVGSNDLSFWLSAFGSRTQTVSCGASCP